MESFNSYIFLIIAIFISKSISSEDQNVSPLVELKTGKVKGIVETSTDGKPFYSYYGIPFAKPPVGKLRFEEPVKTEKWEGIFEANKMPEMCLQLDLFHQLREEYVATGQEDCLYLNVFTPKETSTSTDLPVMVYIHGGGFVFCSASLHQPYVLLNEEIVLVVIQYRLGVFGFLSTEDSSMPGNVGLKDQTMALRWVQENIRSFGGNPDRVTIFGESAGAGSVHLHMLSPHSKGLFKGVIAQSGNALCPWSCGTTHSSYAKTFGEKVNCNLESDGEAFKDCLKEKDAMQLVIGMGSLYKWGMAPLSTNPRVDGDFLPGHPATLVKSGRYNKVNLILGVNRDEGIFNALLALNNPKLKNAVIEHFAIIAPYTIIVENEPNAANLTKVIYDYYLKGKKIEDDPLDEMSEMFSDCSFKICSDLTSLLHSQDSDMNLYLYEFNHRGQRSFADMFGIAVPNTYISHADELYYLFTGGQFFSLPLEREEDIDMRKRMTKLWTNFAKYGNPTPSGSFDFDWNPATSISFKHLSITKSPVMKDYARQKTLDFWLKLDTQLNRLLSPLNGKVAQEKKDEL